MDAYLSLSSAAKPAKRRRFPITKKNKPVEVAYDPSILNQKAVCAITDDCETVLKQQNQNFTDRSEIKLRKDKWSRAEILRRRRERFGEVSPPRFRGSSLTVVNNDTVNTLKKRKERFGESVSTLLREIEKKEKLLKRLARFSSTDCVDTQANEPKILRLAPKLEPPIGCFRTIEQIEEEKRGKSNRHQ